MSLIIEGREVAAIRTLGIVGNRVEGWSDIDAVAAQFVLAAADISGMAIVANRTTLKALDPDNGYAFLAEGASYTHGGRSGIFKWDASVLIATHQLDTAEGIYIAPSAGSNGAWVRIGRSPVKAVWFGVTADGVTDDTAAVQAAIDAACNFNIWHTRLPTGPIKISATIYNDPPWNLRVNFANPPVFGFSMSLVGEGSLWNVEGGDVPSGTQFLVVTRDFPAIISGPGQGMRLADFSVNYMGFLGPRGSFPTTGSAICVAGGNGGASRTLIERCGSYGFYRGFLTGINSDKLGDSNTFFKCCAQSCNIGFHVARTQNYISDLIGCNANHCKIGIKSDLSKSIVLTGGNFSSSEGIIAQLEISAISALSSANETYYGSVINNSSFTVTITPDDSVNDDTFDVFAIETEHFGIVPLVKSAYNHATGVLTLKLYQSWKGARFGYSYDMAASSALQGDLQAATILHCGERIVPFWG